jgi:predicted nucleotidyltransferase
MRKDAENIMKEGVHMDRNTKIMSKLQEKYDIVKNMGYEIVGVFLQGSQNYELDYEDSDIDCKVITLPKFDDFVLNHQPTSTTHVLANDEHIDCKDIRLMFDCFKKQNINFVEILFTKYKIMNSKYSLLFQPLFDNNELIAHYNNYAAINCINGMCMEKYKALEHPYPTIINKIEKYGYDPKQLHHIIRLNEFIKRYINGEPYKDCLISKNKEYLIDVKKGIYSLKEARYLAKTLRDETYEIRNKYMENNKLIVNKKVEEILNKVLVDIMKLNFVSELKVNSENGG